jgi:hypothetical protein
MGVFSPAETSVEGSWGDSLLSFVFSSLSSSFDLPSSKLQGGWKTSDAFDSNTVLNGHWRHLAIAVEDIGYDALL